MICCLLLCRSLNQRHSLQKSIPKSWHTRCLASHDWILSFQKRHIQLTLRIPEGFSRARAEGFYKNWIQAFFNDIQPFHDQLYINNFSSLIYNYNETVFLSLSSVSAKIIALNGSCQVQKLTVGECGTLTTYLATINAAGDNLSPFFIFKETKVLRIF